MHAKVKPPVTPRILPGGPRHRVRNGALLILALLLTGWAGYELGGGRAGGSSQPVAITSDEDAGEWQAKVAGLEQERDTLRKKVSDLQHQLTESGRKLEAALARKPAQPVAVAKAAAKRVESAVEKTVNKETVTMKAVTPPLPGPDPAAVTVDTGDDGRQLELLQVRLDNTDDNDRYRLRFSVRHAGERRVTGTIWVAVNGFTNGKPARLSFKKVSPDRRPYIKMGFNRQQDVEEVLVLPAGFRPKNVLIEAKPYSENFEATSMKYKWITG